MTVAGRHTNQCNGACLRYVNPIGTHPSGRIGEDPCGVPNNLFPVVRQIAIGQKPTLQMFGGDWPSSDGTGVRYNIHVMELAEGHPCALDCLLEEKPPQRTINLSSGDGKSVLDVAHAMEAASNRSIPCVIKKRRPGDAAVSVSDPSQALAPLGWSTHRSLVNICRDGWAWQQVNPMGYQP